MASDVLMLDQTMFSMDKIAENICLSRATVNFRKDFVDFNLRKPFSTVATEMGSVTSMLSAPDTFVKLYPKLIKSEGHERVPR